MASTSEYSRSPVHCARISLHFHGFYCTQMASSGKNVHFQNMRQMIFSKLCVARRKISLCTNSGSPNSLVAKRQRPGRMVLNLVHKLAFHERTVQLEGARFVVKFGRKKQKYLQSTDI